MQKAQATAAAEALHSEVVEELAAAKSGHAQALKQLDDRWKQTMAAACDEAELAKNLEVNAALSELESITSQLTTNLELPDISDRAFAGVLPSVTSFGGFVRSRIERQLTALMTRQITQDMDHELEITTLRDTHAHKMRETVERSVKAFGEAKAKLESAEEDRDTLAEHLIQLQLKHAEESGTNTKALSKAMAETIVVKAVSADLQTHNSELRHALRHAQQTTAAYMETLEAMKVEIDSSLSLQTSDAVETDVLLKRLHITSRELEATKASKATLQTELSLASHQALLAGQALKGKNNAAT